MNEPTVINIERGRELVEILRAKHEAKLRNGEWIEQKGWGILTFASTTLAIVAVFEALLVQSTGVSTAFWIGLIIVLGLYGGLVYAVGQVVKPTDYTYSMELPPKGTGWGEWETKYLQISEDRYVAQLLTNYLGDRTEQGVILDAEETNREKARHLQYAVYLLGANILGLIALAVIAIVF